MCSAAQVGSYERTSPTARRKLTNHLPTTSLYCSAARRGMVMDGDLKSRDDASENERRAQLLGVAAEIATTAAGACEVPDSIALARQVEGYKGYSMLWSTCVSIENLDRAVYSA
eukprot:6188442-Pleurochrysis_carterae.AAC.4